MRVARHYYGRDPAEAEDVAQDALVRAWKRESSLRSDDRRREWLATIARHEAFRHHARQHPEPLASPGLDKGAEDARVVDTAERADLRAALERLAAPDRLLLQLRYVEDLTQPAIAKLLQMPQGTVKVRLHRARAKLRMALTTPPTAAAPARSARPLR